MKPHFVFRGGLWWIFSSNPRNPYSLAFIPIAEGRTIKEAWQKFISQFTVRKHYQ